MTKEPNKKNLAVLEKQVAQQTFAVSQDFINISQSVDYKVRHQYVQQKVAQFYARPKEKPGEFGLEMYWLNLIIDTIVIEMLRTIATTPSNGKKCKIPMEFKKAEQNMTSQRDVFISHMLISLGMSQGKV